MQNQEILEVTGTVETIIYRNDQNGYTVLEMSGDEEITAVGIMPDVNAGEEVKLIGSFKPHHTYGMQFSVTAYEKTMPTDVVGILKYLSSGAIHGIGPATAAAIIREFGSASLEVMENEPERVAGIKGISMEKAQSFSNQIKQNTGVRELMLYLSSYKISPSSAIKVYKAFGSKAVDEIKFNPYSLVSGEFGINFETADAIAQSQDKPKDSQYRIRAGIVYVLNHNKGNGHTCLPDSSLIKTTANFLNVEEEKVREILIKLVEDNTLTAQQIGDKTFVFTKDMYEAESYISARLKMMMMFPAVEIPNIPEQISAIEKSRGIEYADMQKQAITQALTKGLLVLTGGPGTGKTTTLNAIIKILKNQGQKVLLCAPTGRAAQRMSEVTGDEAKTIHRLLEVKFDTTDKLEFVKNEKNMLKCDALIVDEVSMVDARLFECVMKALPLGCRLILVGDSNQLPSVGPGNILEDLVTSEVIPVVALTEIFRQSMESLIVTNAHKIVNGILPELTVKDKDFFFLSSGNKTAIENTAIDLCVRRLPNTYGYSIYKEIQILCPGRKGYLGVNELNKKLQEVVNPKAEDKVEVTFGERVFRIGDKVMQTKNNYDLLWFKDDGENGEGIFNGEIGIIESISKKSRLMKIRFDDKTTNYEFDFASDLDLAYATTVHKSQGNEYEAVIIPLYRGAPQLYYRNLLYTAVTRAKKLLIMVGDPEIVALMVNNDKKTKRYSGLKGFLIDENSVYHQLPVGKPVKKSPWENSDEFI